MPSRLALGRRTNARARLEALRRVMDWLTGVFTRKARKALRVWPAEGPRFAPAWDCADDDRGGGGGDDGDVRHAGRQFPPPHSRSPLRPRSPGSRVRVEDDDGAGGASSSSRNAAPKQ